MLGSLILYLKGTRIVMFQLSGFYYTLVGSQSPKDRGGVFISYFIRLKAPFAGYYKTP